ncbi:ATP-binding protein [Streptomyces sp. SL13]|uniref:ATP-binding protein n=1 Tax=Streptantibioticus silvisoli TaxID=2705255 RepID=A0AA90KA69_9ACTN|nr:ATP-binding protein [Streptantibioticus silvisoli]MDI5964222.1 ATP-binding protein [Streptantibioticus silvisoli]MDI5971712.1 ATP-binding protein [Streptantibioticus silvisoli]
MDRRPEARPVRGAAETTVTRELRRRLRHADLSAVAEARGLLRRRLADWGVPDLRDTAELLLSEVVTNALVHTGGGALLTATLLTQGQRTRLRVEVQDDAPHRPYPRPASDDASGGRGLLIVRALADAWGVRPQPVGKSVWFELTGDPG